MIRVIALVRHGLASGQGPEAALLPEGTEQLRRLGALLGDQGWAAEAVLTSPYLRARESAEVLARMIAPGAEVRVLDELMPDSEPDEAVAAVLRRNRTPARPLDPNAVAVAPFRIATANPALQYLGEGMVDLLAAKLTGQGGPRAVDPRSALSAWRRAEGSEGGDLSHDTALELAQRLGAGQLLLGNVVGARSVAHQAARELAHPRSLRGQLVRNGSHALGAHRTMDVDPAARRSDGAKTKKPLSLAPEEL